MHINKFSLQTYDFMLMHAFIYTTLRNTIFSKSNLVQMNHSHKEPTKSLGKPICIPNTLSIKNKSVKKKSANKKVG